ncbi:hypothetical protein MTP99_013333 [Tenebrio molitor]|nr:hypothetical protein MTP99_013333 [Tenebrio molitor]
MIKNTIATALIARSSNKVASTEVKIAPDMSTAVTNGHQASTEDFAKHVFGAPPRPTRAGSPPTSEAHRSIPAPICEKKAPSSTPDRGYLAAPVFYTIISADKSGLCRSTAAACARLLPQARRLRAFASHSPETCSRQGTLRFPIVESALLNYDRRTGFEFQIGTDSTRKNRSPENPSSLLIYLSDRAQYIIFPE